MAIAATAAGTAGSSRNMPSSAVSPPTSGLGGPARTVAEVVGCQVTGIDLTPEFCAAAAELSRWTGLSDRTQFTVGDATSLDFPDAVFDAAMSVHVAMNIADKAGMYREARRVLKAGGASSSTTCSRARVERCAFRCRGLAFRRRATSRRPSRCAPCSPVPASR
jgi:ubiquinone/menaquinone biosynthesis C-methylase UbiE